MQFDMSVEGNALKVCLEADKTCPPAAMSHALLPAWLPLSASGTKDGARPNGSRRSACLPQGQRKPTPKIAHNLLHRAALVGSHSGAFSVLPEQVVEDPTTHAPTGRWQPVSRLSPAGGQGKAIDLLRLMRLYLWPHPQAV
jgi:hypothetical protein